MFELISACMFISGALLAWVVARRIVPDEASQLLRRRMRSELTSVKRPSVVEVVLERLAGLHARLRLVGYSNWVTRMTASAGLRTAPLHFLVIQEAGAVAGGILYCATMGLGSLNVGWLAICLLVGSLVPVFWVNNRIHARQMTISRDLPEVVDLLTLCVGAGSDFMNALNRVVREFRPCPVREELGIVISEVRVGKRRRDALKAFAERLKASETSSFARTLIQADRMGTGMAEALTVLSEDMRIQRYHWAERFAQQAPLKMLFPLILSLGSALVVVAGPILFQFMKSGFTPNMSAETMPGK